MEGGGMKMRVSSKTPKSIDLVWELKDFTSQKGFEPNRLKGHEGILTPFNVRLKDGRKNGWVQSWKEGLEVKEKGRKNRDKKETIEKSVNSDH